MSSSVQVIDANTTISTIESYRKLLSSKYLANNVLVLSSTSTGVLSSIVEPSNPYANLTNRYFPTVAVVPSSNSLRTRRELGGYFTPSNIGVSIFLTKDISYSVDTTSITGYATFPDPRLYNKGRGLSSADQSDVVTHHVDNYWLKAMNVSPTFDGNIVKTYTYQKFIPYQSRYENTRNDSNGVTGARDDYEYWTGHYKGVWNESNTRNKLTPEKYFDLQERTDQLVVIPGTELYNWQTDIFGNQYALYKTIQEPYSLYKASKSNGQLYIRTLDNNVYSATDALSSIYNKYRTYTFYNELSSNSIINIDVFFDTLVIQLSSAVIYEKIKYNYDTYQIDTAPQSYSPIRYTPEDDKDNNHTSSTGITTKNFTAEWGVLGNTADTYYGGNWYDDIQKTITVCTLLSSTLSANGNYTLGAGVSSIIVPVIYIIDLNSTNNRVRVYPNESTDFIEYVHPLTNGRGVSYMEAPVFTYNEDTNLYSTAFITFSGDDHNVAKYGIANQELFILSHKVKI